MLNQQTCKYCYALPIHAGLQFQVRQEIIINLSLGNKITLPLINQVYISLIKSFLIAFYLKTT